MNRNQIPIVAFAIALVSGCSAARIAIPPAVVSTAQPVQITGMGYGQRGDFALGASVGTFTRHALSADQTRPFRNDQLTSYFGDGSFRVRGPDFDGVVEADCRYLEVEASDGPLTVTEFPFRYGCRFSRDGRPVDASLSLHAVPRKAGPFTTETRSGRLQLVGRLMTIEPIHHSPGLRIPTSEPLGYRFAIDGHDVGAIDLNGERKTSTLLRPGLTGRRC